MGGETVFMVRGGVGVGPFGTAWEMKLLLTAATVGLVLWDWKRNRRPDYLWVFFWGTLIWCLAELVLQATGRREFAARALFGLDLPLWASIPIQGIAEGTSVAVVGIFVADRLLQRSTRAAAAVGYAALMGLLVWGALRGGLQVPDVGGDVPSRRDMIGWVPLLFLAWMVAIDVRFCLHATSEALRRGLAMGGVMLVFAVCWTVSEQAAGTRWIEVGTLAELRRAPPLVEWGALTFDMVIEIVAAYLPYFAIPVYWGQIEGRVRRPPPAASG